jgi:hypothetical protein
MKLISIALLGNLFFAANAIAAPLVIFDGKLSAGFDMGLNTANGTTNWATTKGNELCLNYPGGQKWGALFITEGKPKNPPRTGRDLSTYRQISMELRSQSGKDSIQVGVKDANDPDNGKETLVKIVNIPTKSKKYEFPLSSFKTADLKQVYVPLELVFGSKAANVCVKNIQYLP